MAESSENLKPTEVVVDAVDIEAQVSEDTRRASALVFPPVGKALRGEPIRANFRFGAVIQNQIGDISYLKAEAENLLKLEERYANSSTYLARAASLLQACNEFAKAAEYAKRAAELAQDAVFHYRHAEALLFNGDAATADKIFNDLADSGDLSALYRVAEAAVSRNDIAGAQISLEAALSNYEPDWRLHQLAGTIMLAESRWEEAIQHYRNALEERPNSSAIHLNMALAHYYMGHTDKSLIDSKKALAIDPWNRSALVFYVDVLHKKLEVAAEYMKDEKASERIAKSIEVLEKYLWLQPKDNAAINRLSELYLKESEIAKGIAWLEKAENAKNDPGILNNLGVLWYRKNKENAARYFYDAIDSVGGIINAHTNRAAGIAVLNLGAVFYENKEYEAASEVIESYIAAAPAGEFLQDEILCRIAILATHIKTRTVGIEGAKSFAERMLKSQSLHVFAKIDFATILATYHSRVTGDYSEILKYAKIGYELAASTPAIDIVRKNSTINNLAYALIETGRPEEGRKYLKDANHDVRGSEFVFATEGLLAIRDGNYEQGALLYKIAISKAPGQVKKDELRLKLNLERARYYYRCADYARAERIAAKIAKSKVVQDMWPFKLVKNEAVRLIEEIRQKQLH